MIKINFKNYLYLIDENSKIKMNDYYCVKLKNPATGFLVNLLIFKCLDEKSAEFQNRSDISFKVISTNNPKFQEIFENAN